MSQGGWEGIWRAILVSLSKILQNSFGNTSGILLAKSEPSRFEMAIFTILSIVICLFLMVYVTSVFLMKIVAKRRIERKDAKSWIRKLFDAFWGSG